MVISASIKSNFYSDLPILIAGGKPLFVLLWLEKIRAGVFFWASEIIPDVLRSKPDKLNSPKIQDCQIRSFIIRQK
jgi:hypothetical protein